jgi:pilus assembly protein TadC
MHHRDSTQQVHSMIDELMATTRAINREASLPIGYQLLRYGLILAVITVFLRVLIGGVPAS